MTTAKEIWHDRSPPGGTDTHRQPKEVQKNGLLEREITFRINPWRTFKVLLILVFLVGIFVLGRYSAGAEDLSIDTSTITGLFASDSKADDQVAVKNHTMTITVNESVKAEPEPQAAQESAPVEAAPANETVEAAAEPAAPSGPEVVITEYKKVSFELTNVYKKWLETYGKITGFEVKIVNNEAGTVKPAYVKLFVEGYYDYPRNADLSYELATVKASQVGKGDVVISGGFAYNQVTAGDLASVDIRAELYDANGVMIAKTAKTVNLQN